MTRDQCDIAQVRRLFELVRGTLLSMLDVLYVFGFPFMDTPHG